MCVCVCVCVCVCGACVCVLVSRLFISARLYVAFVSCASVDFFVLLCSSKANVHLSSRRRTMTKRSSLFQHFSQNVSRSINK